MLSKNINFVDKDNWPALFEEELKPETEAPKPGLAASNGPAASVQPPALTRKQSQIFERSKDSPLLISDSPCEPTSAQQSRALAIKKLLSARRRV